MKGIIVASGKLPSFDYFSLRIAGEIVHRITVTGTIDLERRLPLYHATLAINESANYFCILDNSGGHENVLSLPDIVLLDKVLIESGIEKFYGATITPDPNYSGIVKLANYSAEASNLTTDLLATQDPAEAERFIQARLGSVTG